MNQLSTPELDNVHRERSCVPYFRCHIFGRVSYKDDGKRLRGNF